MTQPGWYPDPDDPTARRYWDGSSWSAPLPDPAKASAECAVATCRQPRLRGGLYCAQHGPRVAGSRRPAAAATPSPRAPSVPQVGGSAAIVCPHCGMRGHVRTRRVKVKRGISGGKATGAVLTLGWSMLATGLSRKEALTRATCGNCRQTWTF